MEFLSLIRIEGVEFGFAELRPPWAIRSEGRPVHCLYAVRSGAPCWFETLGNPRVRLRLGPGDVLGVSNGLAHVLRDSLATPLPLAPRALPLRPIRPEDPPPRLGTLVLGGRARADSDPLNRLYPPFVHVSAAASPERSRRLWTLLGLVTEEAFSGERLGQDEALRRLAELIAIELLRAAAERAPAAEGAWTLALADPRIATLLAALQRNLGRRWSVAEMARVAGLGRSALALRFRQLMGETPMRYLRRLRVRQAAVELLDSRRSTAAIASSLGYESEAAFYRAFKRITGTSPGALRGGSRQRAAAPQIAGGTGGPLRGSPRGDISPD